VLHALGLLQSLSRGTLVKCGALADLTRPVASKIMGVAVSEIWRSYNPNAVAGSAGKI
jgi:hypothetical protein